MRRPCPVGWSATSCPQARPVEAGQTEQLQQELQALVDSANKTVSQAEAIKVFRVVPSDFTEASGHLTPSLKIKRAQVLKDFSAVVEDIYSGQKV